MSEWELAFRLYLRLLPSALFVAIGTTVIATVYEWVRGGE